MIQFFNFLNLPAIHVKKAKKTPKHLYDLFVTKEKEGLDWEKDCINAFFSGNIDKFMELSKDKNVNLDTYLLDFLLDTYGSKKTEATKNIIDILNIDTTKDIKNIKEEENELIIRTKHGDYKASRFNDNFKIAEIFPNLTDKNNRKKQCHNLSIKLALNSNFKCNLATGYISNFANDSKYLHSWIETKINNKEKVIDLTKNIIMDKKLFYHVEHITGSVYKISQKTLQKEKALFNKIAKCSGPLSKLYLANRHQAIAIFNSQYNKKTQTQEGLTK